MLFKTLLTTPIAAALLSAAIPASLTAAPFYWDINGPATGAGGVSPSGTWDAAATNWSTDPNGEIATEVWAAGNTAVFAAGTDATGPYTVTITGTQTAAGLTVEEGAVTLAGGTAAVGAGPVFVGPGATLETNSSLRISATAGSVWTLDGGTLRTTNPSNAGSFIDVDATIVLAAGGGTISNAMTNIMSIIQTNVVISGPGSLTKTGPGVIAIASASTYTGPTIINEGELRIRGTANRLPITTAVTVNDPGILNLNGVSQQIGSLSGSGLVGLGSATLTVGDATDTTFSGSIRDTANAGAGGSASVGGKVVKVGSGTLALTGASTYTGATTISAGTVLVNGSLNNTAKVDVTGTLGGTGTISPGTGGNVNLLAGGKLSPGANGVGTLGMTFTGGGKLDLTAGVTPTNSQSLVFQLDTPATSDRITLAGGSLDIGTGVLEFDDFAFTTLGGFASETDYVLFDGNTPIIGTLGTNLMGDVGGFTGVLQFGDGGNDLVLHVVPEPGSIAFLLAGAGMLLSWRRRSM